MNQRRSISRGSRLGRSRPLLLLAVVALLATGYLAFRLLDRRDPEPLFRAALQGLEQGDPAAYNAALPVLEARPDYADHLRLLDGVLLLRLERPQDGLQRFQSISNDSLRHDALRYSAEALYQLRRLSEAESLLRVLVDEQPDDADAHRWLAAIYYDLGAYHAAVAEAELVIALAPQDYRPHRLIGLMYRDFERYGDAVPFYRRVLELSPPADVLEPVRRELAECLTKLLRFDEALDVLQPNDDALSAALAAQCQLTLGRRDLAEEQLARAATQQPDALPVLLLEAELLLTDGAADEAADILEEAARLYPFDAECRYRLGQALHAAGRDVESAEALLAWNELDQLSRRLTELNERALGDLQDADLRRELAEVCDRLGKSELAQMWRDAAADLEQRRRPDR